MSKLRAAFVDENQVDWEDRRAHESGRNHLPFNAIQADTHFREAYEAATGGTPLRYGSQAGYAAFAVEQAPYGAFDHVPGMGLNRPSPYMRMQTRPGCRGRARRRRPRRGSERHVDRCVRSPHVCATIHCQHLLDRVGCRPCLQRLPSRSKHRCVRISSDLRTSAGV